MPAVDPRTGNLPPREHDGNWGEIVQRFGRNPRPEYLLKGLRDALDALGAADIPRVYIDGSFVSAKDEPGDYDACWDYHQHNNFGVLDPIFFDSSFGRAVQKVRFSGEILPADAIADERGSPTWYFFQRDKCTGEPKGIVVIDLRREGQ